MYVGEVIKSFKYAGISFNIVVIDPDGRGEGLPSLGIILRNNVELKALRGTIPFVSMMEIKKHIDTLEIAGLPAFDVMEAEEFFRFLLSVIDYDNPRKPPEHMRERIAQFIGRAASTGVYLQAWSTLGVPGVSVKINPAMKAPMKLAKQLPEGNADKDS